MLKPNISISEDFRGFILHDCTGFYSSENVGGYGIKNPKISEIVSFSLEIKPPSGSSVYNIDMSGDMPNDDGYGYLVRPENFGGFATPGVWTFKVTLTDNLGNVYYSNSYKKLISRAAECCVSALTPKIDFKLLERKDEKQLLIGNLNVLLWAAKEAASCQQWQRAQKLIDIVYAQCKCDTCF